MKWPFVNKGQEASSGPEADLALQDAQKRLDSIKAHEPEVNELVSELRKSRRDDNFTALIREAYRRM